MSRKTIRLIILIFLFSTVLILSACQPTPEQTLVINKGDGKYEQELQEAQEREENPTSPKTTETPMPYEYIAH